MNSRRALEFPFLFGGAFIEGASLSAKSTVQSNFPSFSEGLSLRVEVHARYCAAHISLPFRRGFH